MMSAADLFEDGFPHGTPAGYAEGCKSGACPGRTDFGMSCRMAWQAERSDRRYRRLADEGAPPPVIALELGFVEPEQLQPAAAVTVAAWRVPSTAAPATDVEAAAADLARAGVAPEEVADAAAAATALAEAPADAEPAKRRAGVDLSRPARIRRWARENGVQVGDMGPIRRAVIDAYDEAHSIPAEPDEPTMPVLVVDYPNPASVGSTTVTVIDSVPEHTEHTEPDPLPRPDFGQAMVDVDVESARRIAVRLEQELARVEEELEQAQADQHTLTVALAREQQIAAFAEPRPPPSAGHSLTALAAAAAWCGAASDGVPVTAAVDVSAVRPPSPFERAVLDEIRAQVYRLTVPMRAELDVVASRAERRLMPTYPPLLDQLRGAIRPSGTGRDSGRATSAPLPFDATALEMLRTIEEQIADMYGRRWMSSRWGRLSSCCSSGSGSSSSRSAPAISSRHSC